MRTSILAVGTELTTGQITNRNAPWLAAKLVELGAEVVVHETVPDEHALIAGALARCERESSLIFVTGGLGPTSDDFTRDDVAKWAGTALEFHPPSWEHITGRLGRLGIPVAESNRQQCFFPQGAQVLPNAQGTANGFMLTVRTATVVVLPGPPGEIEAIWRDGLAAKLASLLPPRAPTRLQTWGCMGKSEAELGEITETAVRGAGLTTGYRAHRPFVEVKIWSPEPPSREQLAAIARLDAAIAPWTVTKDGEDLLDRLFKELDAGDEIEVIDAASGGLLAKRFGERLSQSGHPLARSVTLVTEWANHHAPVEWTAQLLEEADPEPITLVLAGFDHEGVFAAGLRQGDKIHVEAIQSPWRNVELPELIGRSRAFAAERALIQWSRWLREGQA